MHKIILLAALSALAGCASTTDKTAEAVPTQVVSETQAVALTTIQQPVVQPEPQVVAAPVQAQPAAQAERELSGWEQLNRRVLAWGDPMRRSMEQYCPPQNTTFNP